MTLSLVGKAEADPELDSCSGIPGSLKPRRVLNEENNSGNLLCVCEREGEGGSREREREREGEREREREREGEREKDGEGDDNQITIMFMCVCVPSFSLLEGKEE